MANFFKSTAFKCVIVLVCLMIVLGGGLAVLNDVLQVTPKERTMRAIAKIYDTQEVEYVTILDVDSTEDNINKEKIVYKDLGSINKIYQVGDDLLFQATGEKGYKNGTITVWVQVITEDGKLIINKVLLESYEKQTLMSQLKSSYYDTFLLDVTNAYKNGQSFTTDAGHGEFTNPISGATKSATAGNNAVNCVINYLGGAR